MWFVILFEGFLEAEAGVVDFRQIRDSSVVGPGGGQKWTLGTPATLSQLVSSLFDPNRQAFPYSFT